MPTAFVAGATGYTGRHVVRALLEQGAKAVAHVRPGSSSLAEVRPLFEGLGAEVDTTPWDREALVETLRRLAPDAVFACLGTTRGRARAAAARGEDATYEAVDIGLTLMLLEACEACGAGPRFVYLSAAGVQPDTKNAYYAARARVEARVREAKVPWTIVRPSFITGADRPEPRPAERAAAAVSDGLLALAGALGGRKMRDRYRSIDGTHLGRAMAQLALDPAAAHRVVEAEDLPRG